MSASKAVGPVAGHSMAVADLDLSDRRRVARSFAASLLLWSIAFLLAALVPLVKPREKRAVYREVAISLASPRSTATASNAGDGALAAPAKQDSDSSARAKAGEAARSARSVNAGTASRTKVSTTQSGLGIPDFAPATGNRVNTGGAGDSLEFGTFEGASGERSETVTRSGSAQTAVPEIEGSVASVKKVSDGPVSASARASRSGEAESVSSETARELAGISGSRAAGTGTGSVSQGSLPSGAKGGVTGSAGTGNTEVTGSGTGQVSSVSGFAFEGRPRGRLYPATISIVLPENLSRLVDSNRTVAVRLTVLADGTVPAGLVAFTPEAALPAEIRDYLAREFSRWRFEKSDQDGQARFSYSIRVQ